MPLVGVLSVELQQSAATGAPRQLTIESCFGRLDRFTFGQAQNARQLDSKATADAAGEIQHVSHRSALRSATDVDPAARHSTISEVCATAPRPSTVSTDRAWFSAREPRSLVARRASAFRDALCPGLVLIAEPAGQRG